MRHFLWYGEVASEGLRSVGANGELPIQERVLYPAPRSPLAGRGSLQWVNPGPHLAAKASGGPIDTAPKRSPGARAPTTASAASTQKSIASMHSPLSLAVGYNRVVTHGRHSCNNVVAILAKHKTPRCARCESPVLRGASLSVTMPGGGTRLGEEVRDGPHNNNRCGGNRGGVARTAAPLRPRAGLSLALPRLTTLRRINGRHTLPRP